MAQTVCILLGDEDRMRLAAIVGDRNRPQKHVQRARIVLLSADRLPVLAVARQTNASPPAGGMAMAGALRPAGGPPPVCRPNPPSREANPVAGAPAPKPRPDHRRTAPADQPLY